MSSALYRDLIARDAAKDRHVRARFWRQKRGIAEPTGREIACRRCQRPTVTAVAVAGGGWTCLECAAGE